MATSKSSKPSNPATGFLRMAGGNLAVSVVFFVIYLIYRGNGGEKSALILVAAIVAMVAAIASFVAFNVFTKKFENAKKR